MVKARDDTRLVVVTARHLENAQSLAGSVGCEADVGWEAAVGRADVDAVVVCTPPDSHAAITIAALRAGKHVLCEKPLARTVAEAEQMVRVSRETGLTLKCGFNHRHHPAIRAAKGLIDAGTIGRPLFARGRYGIGGRPGYEREWRADPRIAAGGQMMEQGIHLVDILRWYLGEFVRVVGAVRTAYWQIAPLEDNGFALLETADGAVASIHASLTQWRNLFSLEVYGTEGYASIDGLGGSYGTQRLAVGERGWGKPFAETVTEYRGADTSWAEEWSEFVGALRDGRRPLGDAEDGLAAMRVVTSVYESAAQR